MIVLYEKIKIFKKIIIKKFTIYSDIFCVLYYKINIIFFEKKKFSHWIKLKIFENVRRITDLIWSATLKES